MAELNPLKGERRQGESDKAVQACNDWLRLGPGRSLPELLVKYGETKQNQTPTQSLATLEGWSAKYVWAERSTAFDSDIEGAKNDRRAEVMQEGLAFDYERVVKLKRLADFLEEQIYEEDDDGRKKNIWLQDAKMIGAGIMSERVDFEKFNAPLIGEYRATLDDIAKEVGGRKVKTEMEHSGSIGVEVKASDLDDDRLAAIISGSS